MTAIPASPPFRAEHIGSLLRPRALIDAWKSRRTGSLDAALFQAILEESIADAVHMQEGAGLQAITDGEFHRVSYWSHFVEAVDGLAIADSRYAFRDEAGHEHGFTAPLAEGRLVRSRPISGAEFDHLKTLTDRTVKITMPSPPTMHFWRGRQTIAPGTYADEEAYFADLAAVYRAELADLAGRGCRYVQIDEVPLAMLCDAQVRERITADGEDPERLVHRYVALINACLADRPADMTIGLHLCRGNHKGQWLSEGGYDSVAELLFNQATVDAFFLEYDTDRAGGFEPLRHLPADKVAVLGLVSSKLPELEPVDALARRIDNATRFAPLDNLALSPQCGFSSSLGGNPLTMDDQRRKLERVVQTARQVWGTLGPTAGGES